MIHRLALLLTMALGHAAGASEVSSQADQAPVYPLAHDEPQQALPSPLAGASANGASPTVATSQVPTEVAPLHVASVPDIVADVVPAEPAVPAGEDTARRLRRTPSEGKAVQGGDRGEGARDASPLDLLGSDATTTALTATALVVGLFLICAWTFRRSLPKSARQLPREAVEILGRCPLGNKQYAHLLHVGNKVILVSITPAGAETLVEVDDPNEVARILGVCASSAQGSTSKEFDAIFQQFAKEPARGFLGDEPAPYSSAASYNQAAQGGTRG